MTTVRRLKATAFGPYEDIDLSLPETGLVAVTGPNGAGKTTLPNIMSHALWGKPLVGEPFWNAGQDSIVEVELADGRAVTRKCRKSGSKALAWTEDVDHATTSKAQSGLESVVGSMNAWRWSAIFLSDAPDLFTRATDKARKELLEEILSLSRFEAALKIARQRARHHEGKAAEHQLEMVRLTTFLQTMQANYQAAPIEEPPEERVQELKGRAQVLEISLKTVQQAVSSAMAEQASAQAQTDDERLYQQLQHSSPSTACSLCGQDLPGDAAERARHHQERLDALRPKVEEARQKRQAVLQETAEKLRSSQIQQQQMQGELVGVQTELRALETQRRQAQEQKAAREKAQAQIDDAQGKLAEVTLAQTEALRRAQLYGHAQKVLGLKGVRARLTGRSLDTLQAYTNLWLQRLAGDGWSVQFLPYAENKSGGTSEAISLKVVAPSPRFAGSRSYWSCSAGQRRRFDLAVMLGIADLVRASGGGRRTLWFDEALDALDVEGKQRAVALLQSLAQDNCVVVVAHDQDVLDQLRPARIVQVESGRLTCT